MYFISRKTSLLILAVTSVVLSRLVFSFINDPEGPNLLIVMGLAVIIFAVSLGMYYWYRSCRDSIL